MASCITSDPFVKNSKNWGTTFARLRTLRSCSKLMSDGGRLASSGSAECSPWRSMTHRSTRFSWPAIERESSRSITIAVLPASFSDRNSRQYYGYPVSPAASTIRLSQIFLFLVIPSRRRLCFRIYLSSSRGHGYAFLGRGLKSGGFGCHFPAPTGLGDHPPLDQMCGR